SPEDECEEILCPLDDTESARWDPVWTEGNGVHASASCKHGYESDGTPTRECHPDGVWSDTVVNPCERVHCQEKHENNASYPRTPWSSSPVEGTCDEYFEGTPTRFCNSDGEWQNEEDSCQPKRCPSLPGSIDSGEAQFLDVAVPAD